MKVGLLGTGKTGSMLVGLESDVETISFNSKNKPTLESLKDLDVVIAFVSAPVFLEYLPLLIEAKTPVVSAATGDFSTEEIDLELKKNNLSWIWGSNFSLGMTIVKRLIEELSSLHDLYEDVDYSIHEVHHTKKLDAPSGTAKSWGEWLGIDCEISSERTGDVVGIHELSVKTPFEEINLKHESHNRKLFAKGALWAARFLLKHKLSPGLHHFDQIVKEYLGEKNV